MKKDLFDLGRKLNSFDKDLRRIITDRAGVKLNRLREDLKTMGKIVNPMGNPIKWDEKDFWEPHYQYIFNREVIERLYDDLEGYKKKYPKSDYEEDIKKARGGNLRRLLRIIEWDKGWLFVDGIKQQVLDAQEDGDLKFLKQVGEAIAKKPGIKKQIRNDEKTLKLFIVRLVETFITYHRFQLPVTSSNPILKQFYEWLVKQKFFPEDIFADRDYFMKFLRRHGVIR